MLDNPRTYNPRTYWALVYVGNHKTKLGPFDGRDAALSAAQKLHTSRRREILTGYGADDAWFDLRWHRLERH